MRIDDNILRALKRAVEESGGGKEFAARCQVSASNISRYLSGKVRSVSDDSWEKIRPFLDLPPVSRAAGTIANTPELRDFLRRAMREKGMESADQLRRAVGYGSTESFRRIFDGELNWFPDVLSAVFDALECDVSAAPISRTERGMLAPGGLYRDGAILVRPVPVVDWANAASHLDALESDNVVMRGWDVENTPTVPVPADARRNTSAFRVHGISMEPRILDDDIVLVEPAESPECVPDNKVVVVRFTEESGIPEKVVCKRFRRQGADHLLLTSDNPDGRIIPVRPEEISWIGIVVKKISEM